MVPTPRPTAKPTKAPTPKPGNPGKGKSNAHPPCPSKGGTPPGHAKADGAHQSCGKGKGSGNPHGGIIVVLPLVASSVAWSIRPERLRPRRRAR